MLAYHQAIITDVLGMKCATAKIILKLLNIEQKQLCLEVLTTFNYNPDLLKKIITGDESWVFGYEIETEAQTNQWKGQEEPRPKKARHVRSNVKVLLNVFLDFNGVVHHEFLPQDRTVNREYYLEVMHPSG